MLPEHLRRAKVDGYEIHFDARHRAWVAELERRFDMVWSSMWQRNAPDPFGVHAGFGTRWPWLNFDRHNRNLLEHDPYAGKTSGRIASYKMGALVEYIGDRPTVIVDDDFGRHERAWAEARTQSGIPTLVLTPDYEYGMERRHVDAARAFARKLRQGATSAPRW